MSWDEQFQKKLRIQKVVPRSNFIACCGLGGWSLTLTEGVWWFWRMIKKNLLPQESRTHKSWKKTFQNCPKNCQNCQTLPHIMLLSSRTWMPPKIYKNHQKINKVYLYKLLLLLFSIKLPTHCPAKKFLVLTTILIIVQLCILTAKIKAIILQFHFFLANFIKKNNPLCFNFNDKHLCL